MHLGNIHSDKYAFTCMGTKQFPAQIVCIYTEMHLDRVYCTILHHSKGHAFTMPFRGAGVVEGELIIGVNTQCAETVDEG
jgi:hypothetical protein